MVWRNSSTRAASIAATCRIFMENNIRFMDVSGPRIDPPLHHAYEPPFEREEAAYMPGLRARQSSPPRASRRRHGASKVSPNCEVPLWSMASSTMDPMRQRS